MVVIAREPTIRANPLDRRKITQPGLFMSAVMLELALTRVDKTAD